MDSIQKDIKVIQSMVGRKVVSVKTFLDQYGEIESVQIRFDVGNLIIVEPSEYVSFLEAKEEIEIRSL